MLFCHLAVVYDMNGREASDVEPVLNAVGDIEQYIFCSSAGVYLKSDQMPHREEDSTDPKSRHNAHPFAPVSVESTHCPTAILTINVRHRTAYEPVSHNQQHQSYTLSYMHTNIHACLHTVTHPYCHTHIYIVWSVASVLEQHSYKSTFRPFSSQHLH